MDRPSVFAQVVLTAAVGLLSGCDLSRIAANQTANVFERAAPAIDAHWDYELAGDALPASIVQLEGLLHVAPENTTLSRELARAYVGYAYGWIEDEMEVAEGAGDIERADQLRARARAMYVRAKNLALHAVRLESEGFGESMGSGLPALERWLAEEFDEQEDAPLLFWTGYAWGSAINLARDDAAMIADLPYAKAFVSRSVTLDPAYYHASGLVFLGFAAGDLPPALGGDPAKARQFFERALALTQRKALLVQLNYARSYAVATQDRPLFESLLREVLAADEPLPEARLLHRIAKRRARRYLTRVDDLIFPAD